MSILAPLVQSSKVWADMVLGTLEKWYLVLHDSCNWYFRNMVLGTSEESKMEQAPFLWLDPKNRDLLAMVQQWLIARMEAYIETYILMLEGSRLSR